MQLQAGSLQKLGHRHRVGDVQRAAGAGTKLCYINSVIV